MAKALKASSSFIKYVKYTSIYVDLILFIKVLDLSISVIDILVVGAITITTLGKPATLKVFLSSSVTFSKCSTIDVKTRGKSKRFVPVESRLFFYEFLNLNHSFDLHELV